MPAALHCRRLLPLVLLSLAPLLHGCGEAGPDGEGSGRDERRGTGDFAEAARAVDGRAILAHMRALAHDSMAGRAPGSEGGRMAGRYIAERFERAGLEPVDGSWYQAVPMVGTTARPGSVRLAFEGADVRPTRLDDYVMWAGDGEAERARAEGELVFVGYGIDAPEVGWSDFGDADLAGKVLLILVNDPPAPADEPELFGGPAMTYYGRWTYKFEEAARQGAAAAFIVHTTEEAGYGWQVVRSSWSGEQFSLPADASAPRPVAIEGWLTRETAAALLSAAGHDLEELRRAAASRDFTPVSTGVRVSAAVDSDVRRVETRNVVGLLPGSSRPDEFVTLTSHYDHFGIGEPVDGDSIFNGAYDNASGTGMLIAVAEALSTLDRTPARSILFIATGAEEQGLLGASWYVQSPLVPLERTVAEINVDGANLWGETDDLIAMGADRSELGDFVRRRAEELGMELAPDAEPEKGFFFRSDHFPFARAGVPSLYLEHGRRYRGRPEGWGQEILDDYTANRYHAPSDEFSEDFTPEGAVQQARVVLLTLVDIADSDAWPNWFETSEFRSARDGMMGGR